MPRIFPIPVSWLGALLVLAALLPGLPRAESLSEDNVKAGFILNFARYTEWPSLGNSELRICGLGPSGRLAQLQGRQAHGLEVRVYISARPEEWRTCHVLLITASESQRQDAVLRAVAQAPVLTIGDGRDFVRSGGMIGFTERGGRIRFYVNQGTARKVGIGFSSQMLKLADEVMP